MCHYLRLDLGQCSYLRVSSRPACWGTCRRLQAEAIMTIRWMAAVLIQMVLWQRVISMAGNWGDGVQPPGDDNEMLNRNPKWIWWCLGEGCGLVNKQMSEVHSTNTQVLGHWQLKAIPLLIVSSWWCCNVLSLGGQDWLKGWIRLELHFEWSAGEWVGKKDILEHTVVYSKYYLISLSVKNQGWDSEYYSQSMMFTSDGARHRTLFLSSGWSVASPFSSGAVTTVVLCMLNL